MTRRAIIGGIVLAVSAVVLMSCSASSELPEDTPSAETPVVVLRPLGQPEVRVRVEIARTTAERSRGLMFREHLDPDAGMLFIYEDEQGRSFWMKNTLIPLDMIFIGKDLRVAGVVENAEPETETLRTVGRPSQFVLEVNGGFAAQHGITVGTEVEFLGIDYQGDGSP